MVKAIGKEFLPQNLTVVKLKNTWEASSGLLSQLLVMGLTDVNKNIQFINKRMEKVRRWLRHCSQ